MSEEDTSLPKRSATDLETSITASFGCFGCLCGLAIILASLAAGILALKYAWAFLVWAWKLTVSF